MFYNKNIGYQAFYSQETVTCFLRYKTRKFAIYLNKFVSQAGLIGRSMPVKKSC